MATTPGLTASPTNSSSSTKRNQPARLAKSTSRGILEFLLLKESVVRTSHRSTMSFIEELMRRNDFRVGIAYVVVSWIVLQVVDIVLPTLAVLCLALL